MSNPTKPSQPIAILWALPLLAGLLPAIGAITAAILSMQAESIPACNPLIDGCVSISRAARQGLANQVFRAFVLPGAVLQTLTWWLMGYWLQSLIPPTRRSWWLPILGLTAGIFLILYASFLGVEGDIYRWLRRYGTVGYFGGTFIAILIVLRTIWTHRRPTSMQISSYLALCIVLLGLCVANTAVAPLFADPLKDRIENVSEWWAGIAFTLVFFLTAWMWWSSRVSATISATAPKA